MWFLVRQQTLPSSLRHSTHRSRTVNFEPKMKLHYTLSLLIIISISTPIINCLENTINRWQEQQENSSSNFNSTSPLAVTTIQDGYSIESNAATTQSNELYSSTEYESIRPFYNIAHMVNSIREVNYYLSKGANAIEADLRFAPNGTALYTFHGYPCDCFRHCSESEDIVKFLQYIRNITVPGEE